MPPGPVRSSVRSSVVPDRVSLAGVNVASFRVSLATSSRRVPVSVPLLSPACRAKSSSLPASVKLATVRVDGSFAPACVMFSFL